MQEALVFVFCGVYTHHMSNNIKYFSKTMNVEIGDFEALIALDGSIKISAHTFAKELSTWLPIGNFELSMCRNFNQELGIFEEIFLIKNSHKNHSCMKVSIGEFLDAYCSG